MKTYISKFAIAMLLSGAVAFVSCSKSEIDQTAQEISVESSESFNNLAQVVGQISGEFDGVDFESLTKAADDFCNAPAESFALSGFQDFIVEFLRAMSLKNIIEQYPSFKFSYDDIDDIFSLSIDLLKGDHAVVLADFTTEEGDAYSVSLRTYDEIRIRKDDDKNLSWFYISLVKNNETLLCLSTDMKVEYGKMVVKNLDITYSNIEIECSKDDNNTTVYVSIDDSSIATIGCETTYNGDVKYLDITADVAGTATINWKIIDPHRFMSDVNLFVESQLIPFRTEEMCDDFAFECNYCSRFSISLDDDAFEFEVVTTQSEIAKGYSPSLVINDGESTLTLIEFIEMVKSID